MSTANPLTDLLAGPLAPGWTIEGLAEQVLAIVAAQPADAPVVFALNAEATADRQTHRLLRPLLACLAMKSAMEAGVAAELFGGNLFFQRSGPQGPVGIVGEFENRPGAVRLTLQRSAIPLAGRATRAAAEPVAATGPKKVSDPAMP